MSFVDIGFLYGDQEYGIFKTLLVYVIKSQLLQPISLVYLIVESGMYVILYYTIFS